jgi:putative Mg2+ transporter-C (MgtC) family protein
MLVLESGGNLDVQSRVLQGLITGIGFVGAGAILRGRTNVRGTATAASVWNAGVIGASVAMGKYGIAVVLSLLNVFTLHALPRLKDFVFRQRRSE